MGGRTAVFLDRDGTITVERGHVTRPEDLELLDGAADAVRALNDAGVLAVLASNQSGVARGLMTEDDLARVHRRLEELLRERGARLDGAYYCPYYAGGSVPRYTRDDPCRKPGTGMLERAVRELAIGLASSWLVGDSLTDIETADRAGIPGILVLTGKGRSELARAPGRGRPVPRSEPDLAAAVRTILLATHPAETEGGHDAP
jgi:D-glycero-D-manno-heptose 1,7-bisphosphate phosphatase